MSVITPSITAREPHEYREQIDKVTPFTKRLHIDVMDGEFAPVKSVNPIQVWWPSGLSADIHVMFQRPLEHLETLISLQPNLIIIHAEAEGDLKGMVEHLHKFNIKVGVGLLKDTTVESAKALIAACDHILLFSGNLGHFGGTADLNFLHKISEIKAINSSAEIGWDGGINESNILEISQAGVDVITVGGTIQKAEEPAVEYQKLLDLI